MLGVTVATRNVNLHLAGEGEARHFLRDVNFLARPGEMTAIMGPSGCGKTTFLNVMSNRQSRAATVTGEVLYQGRSDVLPRVNDFSAYVMQEDFFLQHLTVRETLNFAARLRLPHLRYADQLAKAARVIKELGLEDCADVLVGGRDVKGVSGGQRKRVSIAVALLDEPKVLFLDEPTSGLDAALAFDVVNTLARIAKHEGRTVIATIHQPRAEVYAMFDRLLLLRNGHIVYHGPCNTAADFFRDVGYPCPEDYNVSDFYLDLLTEANQQPPPGSTVLAIDEIGPDAPTDKPRHTESRIRVDAETADGFAREFEKSEYNSATISEIEGVRDALSPRQGATKPADESWLTRDNARRSHAGRISKWIRSVWILTLRGIRDSSRRPQYLYVNFIQVAFIGVVVGSIWYKVDKPVVPSDTCDTTVARNAMGGMMQIVANTAFSSFDSAVQQIGRRPLVNRESSGGLYHRTAAMVANWLSDGCFHYWASMIYAVIVYWTMDLRHSAKAYVLYLLFAWTIKFSFWGSSSSIGALSPNLDAGLGLIPLSNVLLFLVSGYQRSDGQVPKGLIWLKYISPIRYAWQGIVRSQIDPDHTGYLEKCFEFETPARPIVCWAIIIGIALTARLLGLWATAKMHTTQGVQA